ncbi:MAG: ribosomal protein large subunit ribosomal protein [Candidatus Taylorbacteria bacterium]|nr:ribosomal protein large subunit ribosomal protein [Candidatus Taylorbacteria bacterium]
METTVYNQKGESAGKVALPESIFGLKWNADLVHQVVVSMQSSARHSIANTKTRGEVSGGGKKPWQQKGTGRARHGSTRSPIWVGGGVAHGPRKEKNYDRKVNKKTKVKAFLTILAQKHRDGELLFVDTLSFGAPKAKDAKIVLMALSKIKGFEKLATKPKNAAIIAVDKKHPELMKSFKNFGNVEVEEFRTVNPVSALNHKYIVITNPAESLKMLEAKIK